VNIMRKLTTNTYADISDGAAMMGVVVATLVAIIVGVMVWYKVNASVFASSTWTKAATDTAAKNLTWVRNSQLWNSTNTTADTIWVLFPIVCIVIIAGIVLAVVMGFGKQNT